MNFLKRSLLAVIRKKGRTAILLILFIAISNLVLTGFAIRHATEYASVLARQKLGGTLTLSFNTQQALQNARSGGLAGGLRSFSINPLPITEEMADLIASHENIQGFNYIVNAYAIAEGFEPFVLNQQDAEQLDNVQENNLLGRLGSGMPGIQGLIPDFTITGVASTELMNNFSNGTDKLVDGRHITVDDNNTKAAIIEVNLAEENGLKVADVISLRAPNTEDLVEFTIIGIYESGSQLTSQLNRFGRFPFAEPFNSIYTDYGSSFILKAVLSDTGVTSSGIDRAVFYVDDPENIDKVKADVQNFNIDWNSFILDANDAAYQQMMGPIENVASFSMTIVYLVSIAGALILALILMLSVKDRMYETGVLLSMGEGKMKIVSQYVAEVVLIAIIACSLSMFSGKVIAQSVGNMLLSRELQVVQIQDANPFSRAGREALMQGAGGGMLGGFMGRGFQTNSLSVQPIDSLDIQITMSEFWQLSFAGLLIILGATIIPASMIMKYNPKAILTKAT